MAFLGNKEIKKVMEIEGSDLVEVSLFGGQIETDETIKINKNLLSEIQTENIVNQYYYHLINSVLATKFLEQMATYGLEYKYVSPVAQAMCNLSFNLRDDSVAKKFSVEHPDDIQLNDIIKTK